MSFDIGSPEQEAAAILNLLDEVGLKGPKLALSNGSEEVLSQQVADALGLEMQEWHLDFIRSQVRAAVQLQDLEGRLAGDAASVSMQRINDAVAAEGAKRRKVEDSEAQKPLVIVPKKGTLGKSVRLRTGRLVMEEEVEGKILRTLLEELRIADAPVLKELESVANADRAAKAPLGKYRVSTVRRYLASWQHFRRWVELGYGPMTKLHPVAFIDYMYAREEQGLGPSVPLSVAQAVAWFEKLANVEEERRISASSTVQMVISELSKKLESKAPPVKRAPRWLTCFIGPIEKVVMDEESPVGRRLCAWFKLIKLWASLRFSDAAQMRSKTLRCYDGKLEGVLVQTKTTGAGKRVRELPLFIADGVYAEEAHWLECGYHLWKREGSMTDHYVFPEGVFGGLGAYRAPVTYQEAVAASAELFGDLTDGHGSRLLPDGWSRFWTEHSERSTLASGLAALGVQKSDRDMLGRWQPEGSDQYIRTYSATVGKMQRRFAEVIRKGNAYKELDEGGTIESIKEWLVQAWSVEPQAADRAVEAWKKKLEEAGLITMTNMDWLDEEDEVEAQAPEVPDSWEDLQRWEEPVQKSPVQEVSEDMEEQALPSPASPVSPFEGEVEGHPPERRDGSYVVVYRRAGRGTLHRLDASGCWMAHRRDFLRSEVYSEAPEPYLYSVRCKLCWPEKDITNSESTSDSCDELDLSDDE